MVPKESPTRTQVLATDLYIAMHVKDPTFLNYSYWIRLPSRALADPTPSDRSVGIRLLFLGWTSSILINSNWAARRAIRLCHLRGPPGLAGYLALLLDTC